MHVASAVRDADIGGSSGETVELAATGALERQSTPEFGAATAPGTGGNAEAAARVCDERGLPPPPPKPLA